MQVYQALKQEYVIMIPICSFDHMDKASFDVKASNYKVIISAPTGTTSLENAISGLFK